MTVGEVRAALDNYGDHIEVVVERVELYEVVEVETTDRYRRTFVVLVTGACADAD